MDKEIENNIIMSFIIKTKKERAKYELWNYKKRNEFIWQIENKEFLDKRFIKKIIQPVPSYMTIYDMLIKKGVPNKCYVISIDNNIDGKVIFLKDALKVTVNNGPVLISCIHGKLAYFEGEENGVPNRYLLIKE